MSPARAGTSAVASSAVVSSAPVSSAVVLPNVRRSESWLWRRSWLSPRCLPGPVVRMLVRAVARQSFTWSCLASRFGRSPDRSARAAMWVRSLLDWSGRTDSAPRRPCCAQAMRYSSRVAKDPPQNDSDGLTGLPVVPPPSSAFGRPSSFEERANASKRKFLARRRFQWPLLQWIFLARRHAGNLSGEAVVRAR